MKKFFLILAISLCVAGSVSAQRFIRQRYQQTNRSNVGDDFYQPKLGFDIGANFSNSITSYNSNYKTGSIIGLNAGLTLDLPIIYPLSFAPEVLFSQKGYEANTADGDFTQRTNYIEIPLLAKFHLSPMFNIFVGPQLSYLLSTTNTYSNGFTTSSEHFYENNNGHKSFLDGVIGVSFDLNRSVDLHGRYTIDLQQTDSNGNTYVPDYRNQVWQIGLGFKF